MLQIPNVLEIVKQLKLSALAHCLTRRADPERQTEWYKCSRHAILMLQISNVPDIVSLADLHTQKACKLRNVNVPDTDMQCLQWTQSTSKIVTHGWSFKHKLVDFLRSYQNHALVQCPLVLCQMSPINPVKRTFLFFYFIRLQF